MPNLQARAMRREPTEPERLLWARLRDRRLGGHKFRRQHPLGAFVADFACLERRLIVEADGEQHLDSEYDAYRSEWLRAHGWRVIRFWNNEVRENPNPCLAPIKICPLLSVPCTVLTVRVALQSRHTWFRW